MDVSTAGPARALQELPEPPTWCAGDPKAPWEIPLLSCLVNSPLFLSILINFLQNEIRTSGQRHSFADSMIRACFSSGSGDM